MNRTLRLIAAENLKLYGRRSTRWMTAAVPAAALITAVFDRLYVPFHFGLWDEIAGQAALASLVTLFTIIAGGGIVANEFNWGTVKLLLIRPVNRGRILEAKYLTMALYGLTLLGLLLATSVVVNGILQGVAGGTSPPEELAGGRVVYNSIFLVLKLYLLRYFEVLIWGSIAWMLSTVTKSNAAAIGTTFFALLLGPELTRLLFPKFWAEFVLFSHTDFGRFAQNASGLGSSLAVAGVYLAVFYFVAWLVFTRQDVMG